MRPRATSIRSRCAAVDWGSLGRIRVVGVAGQLEFRLRFPVSRWLMVSRAQELTLTENGVAKAPIVVFENAPPFTRQAVRLWEESEKTDTEARERSLANWDKIVQIYKEHPHAMNWRRLEPRHGRTAAFHPDGRDADVRMPR